MERGNIFAGLPAPSSGEFVELLAGSENIRIERIISRGHHSPDNFWYDQEQNEWVFLVKGKAGIKFAEDYAVIELAAGDYINIPAHVRHRVEWTAGNEETIWLAFFY